MGLFGAAVLAVTTSRAQPAAPDAFGAGTAAVQPQGDITPPAEISPGAAEIIRMASSGIAEDVILAYINNAQTAFDLTADQVVYLKDLGVSPNIITAMLNRDTALRNSAPVPEANPSTAPPPPAPEPPIVEGPMTPTASAPVDSAPPEDVSYFYDDLAPYGSWITLDGVGWCWQPRTVAIAHGWRPYCDGGHWVYSESGWYWASDYSWGWAPFHYGRWYLHPRCGWVWTPDRVWGPAWVTWRVAGDNCGWAPLPPHAVFVGGSWRFNGVHVGVNFDFGLRPDHFTFVGIHDFIGHDIRHHAFGISEVRNVYRHTTIVNNTIVHNNVIVNRGIPVDRVSAVTRTTIKPAVIREASPGGSRIEHRAGGRTAEPVVYRHDLPAHPKPARVTAEHVDSSHPIVHHNELPPVQTGRSYSGSSQAARARTDNFRSRNSGGISQNPSFTRPATRTPSVAEGPRTTSRFNYGRYGDAPRGNSSLQSPKQTTVEPSHQWSSRPSGGSSYQPPARDYTPRSFQQHGETYTPPASRSERAPAYSPPSHSDHSDRSYSAPSRSERSFGGGSSSRESSRDDSGSGRRH